MKICVIHGSNRKGNTEKTIEIVKKVFDQRGEISYTDFYLPKDLPHFCNGCFACLQTGEYAGQNCPHKQYTHPILKAMVESDGLIITSPSYALSESAQVKALLDHFACTYLNHRPNEEMFDKIALVISTAAGAGTGRVVSTLSRNLLFWGVKRTIKCKINMWVKDWDQMEESKRKKAEALLERKATAFYHAVENRYHIRPGISTTVLRYLFTKLVKGYADTEPDKIYWKAKGWI